MSLAQHGDSPFRTFTGPFGDVRVRVHVPEQRGAGGLIFLQDAAPGSAVHAEYAAARCTALAAAGACTVLAVESALLREPKYPRAVDEAYFIACFLHEHVDELGLDHRRIGLGGAGSGAMLATAAARLAKERRNPELAFQLLLWPWLDLRALDPACAKFAASYLPSAQQADEPRASPLVAKNLIGLPPALLVTAPTAERKQEAESYVAALNHAFVTSTLAIADDLEQALPACGSALRTALSTETGASGA